MKSIALTHGEFALVDDEDYEWLKQFRWYPKKLGHTIYAARTVRDSGGWTTIWMHRQILGLVKHDGIRVDHHDGNGLHNCRANLRLCNQQENLRNQRARLNSSSVYKGVRWRKDSNKWQALITDSGRQICLGCYIEEFTAAKVYDRAARRLFGEFANPNIASLSEIS